MTRWENYLLSAAHIVHTYDGTLPLHHFLRTFFREHPKMGSRDRRRVSQLVYAFYRLGHLWRTEMPAPERILLGQFLCATQADELLAFFQPEWNEKAALPLPEKLRMISPNGQAPAMEDIFPFVGELSEGIAPQEFVQSYFTQPRLFIRVRKHRQDAVAALLQQAGVPFTWQAPDVLSLPNGTSTEAIIPHRDWYEVQDASSRQTGRLFQPKPGQRWWDCCAASGGKSLLLLDQEPNVQLTVSDIRPSILHNLQQRFAAAGVQQYESKVLDLAKPVPPSTFGKQLFDGIILDAPCSGSGTWGRTPESLYFFRQEQIASFQALQKRIAGNVIPLLKPGGRLIYITCSVFRQENEAVVQHLCGSAGLQWQAGGVIAGYMHGADTMFANVLKC